jgi:CheY-like chemotaxis protein
MGGTLGVTSTPGRGSCFTCALPLVLAEAPAPSTPERRTLPPGLKVLVVDDNAVNRLVAQRLLERTGCQVTSATGASEALAAGPVDVVLMDVHMPELDGLEATRRLRARPGGEAPLIIGVSASAASEDIQSCLEAGMDDFLAKPVTQGRLLDTLLRHLDASVARGDKLVDGPRRAEVDRACSIPMQGEK